MIDKKLIRREVLSKRNTFSASQLQKVSIGIFKNIKRLKIWQKEQVVHIYLPIEEKNEIDTWPISAWLLENGHEVWASYLPEDTAEDGFCKISESTIYQKDRFGAPLPIEKVLKNIHPSVVIVPCLAADRDGDRIGYGSGWYDKFLAKHPNATKIGLVPEMFLLEQVPHEPYDEELNIIVTETQTLHIKRG